MRVFVIYSEKEIYIYMVLTISIAYGHEICKKKLCMLGRVST